MRITNRFNNQDKSGSFNVTPLIDIVFLLIIFFLVVCQFIEAENFPVTVPDNCEFAQDDENGTGGITVTVMSKNGGRNIFAVGSEKIIASNYADIVERVTELIDIRLNDLPADNRVVTLRIDKDVYFSEAQYALAAVAASSATDIQLAAFKEKHSDVK